MISRSSRGRLFHLPGRRFAVPARDYPRATWAATLLIGVAPLVMAFRPTHATERTWARLAVRLLGIELAASGLDHIDPAEQYVVAPLHEGFADVPALLQLPLSLRFVTRDELAGWRVLGGYLARTRHPQVVPERPVAAYRTLLRAGEEAFAAGTSLVVFPQGGILGIEAGFSAGAFRLADRYSKPVLPVVLAGSHRVWEYPFSPRVRFGCRIRMEVLAPLPVGGAVAAMRELEAGMKRIALSHEPGPRRFVPERDGWWDGYNYRIDPAFEELAARVEHHRAMPQLPQSSEGSS